MKIPADIARRCAELGAEINDNSTSDSWNVEIVAPTGTKWCGLGVHAAVNSCFRGPREWLAAMWDAVRRDIADGVEPCDDPECEWCVG